MTVWQVILVIIITCAPLFLIKLLKNETSAKTYTIGYTLGLLVAIKLMEWFGW